MVRANTEEMPAPSPTDRFMTRNTTGKVKLMAAKGPVPSCPTK